MITSRALLVGFVGGCFYLIALVNSLSTFYYSLTWLTIGILVSSMGLALLSLVGVECRWKVTRSRVTESIPELHGPVAERSGDGLATDGLQIDVAISNAGSLNKTGILVELLLDGPGHRRAHSRRFLVEALPSGSSLAATLSLEDIPRGRYTLAGTRLIGSDVLGLFRMHRRIPWEAVVNGEANGDDTDLDGGSSGELVVGPAMIAVHKAGEGFSQSPAYTGPQNTHQLGQSDEVRGTRGYVAGDDLRQVHWKSTARYGQLVVKEFHSSSQNHCTVLWDGALETTWGTGTVTTTEYGIRVVASLCRTMLERGRPCTLLRLDSHPLRIASDRRAGQGVLTLANLVDVLADADALRDEPLSQVMSPLVGNGESGGDTYLVTASLSPDVRHAVTQCASHGHRITVVLVDGSRFADLQRLHDSASGYTTRPQQQHWKAFGLGQSGCSEVTSEAYATQARRLREAGVRVIAMGPTKVPGDIAGPVRDVLRQIVLNQAEGGAATPRPGAPNSLLEESDLDHMRLVN